jgi:superfamily I DNA and/or RNA helicase/very-short-patch-repair endonuclease/transcription elongation GreA/GreB family factor
MKKDQYLNILNYLYEFSKIRSISVKDIITDKSRYQEVLWLNEIENNSYFKNIIFDNNNENQIWLTIKKPSGQQPEEPKLTIDDELNESIDKLKLIQGEEDFIINRFTSKDEDNIPISALSLKEKLNIFLNHDWPKIQNEFKTEYNDYLLRLKEYETNQGLYNKFFTIYNKIQQFNEDYEIVIGAGFLQLQNSENNPVVRRHLFTTKVELDFIHDENNSSFIVHPSESSKLTIENDLLLDLDNVFQINGLIDAEDKINTLEQNGDLDNFIFSEKFHFACELLSSSIHHNCTYNDSIFPKSSLTSSPEISFAPSLILRKRNASSISTVYEQIISQISIEDNPDVELFNDLVGVNGNKTEIKINDEILFFPKPYNEEQEQIIKNATQELKTLVQGPPGTGKSHTIANIICHLLATGNKVLITAQTKRALEVLKDKLPERIKPLVVEYLGSDSKSIKGLKESINGISDQLYYFDESKLKNEINESTAELINLKKGRENLTKNLLKYKETNLNIELNPRFKGSPTTLAEIIFNQEKDFNWYDDLFQDFGQTEIVNSPHQLFIIKGKINEIDFDFKTYEIPNIELIPSFDQFKIYCDQIKEINRQNKVRDNRELIKFIDKPKLISLLSRFRSLIIEMGQDPFEIKDNIIHSLNIKEWNNMVTDSQSTLKKANEINIEELENLYEIEFEFELSFKRLISDLKTIKQYLKEGNKISGIFFTLKKRFISKSILDKFYIFEKIRINGTEPENEKEIDCLIDYFTTLQSLDDLEEIWGLRPNENNKLYHQIDYYHNLVNSTSIISKRIEELISLQNEILDISSIDIDYKDAQLEIIDTLLEDLEFSELLKNNKKVKNEFLDFLYYLDELNTDRRIKHEFKDIYTNAKLNDFQDFQNKIENITDGKLLFEEYSILESVVKTNFPRIFDKLDDFCEHHSTKDLLEAIYYLNAKNKFQLILKNDLHKKIDAKLDEIKIKESSLIGDLAAKKSWYSTLNHLSKNSDLKRNLNAWISAVSKIPKSGKYLLNKRKIAQNYLEKSKDAIPCWIMPIFKIAETITPKQGMYDYVIIDEASQLGPDALFLRYLGKKIIIVGDDKQTSPEYVGINSETVLTLIKKYLKNTDFREHYGIDYSFFDHSKIFVDNTIVLREHFRCMPEIIDFSNKHFYLPENKGLFPLKQYSNSRLQPLANHFVPNAETSGKGASIFNMVEVNAIVNEIDLIVKNPRYDGKSIGVICLQGHQQSLLIEKKLIKSIGEIEYNKRKIICGNSSSFQGDERDIIILSLVTAPNSDRRAFTGANDERRFNVAMSRAIEQVILFHSIQLNELKNTEDLRYKLLQHFNDFSPQKQIIRKEIDFSLNEIPSGFDSRFEVSVYNEIIKKGYEVIPQYEIANGKYRIDLAIILSNGAKIAIECDGDQFHGPEQFDRDNARQKVLERVGWQFFRIRGSAYYANKEKSLEDLWTLLEMNEMSVTEVKTLEIGSMSINQLNEISNQLNSDSTIDLIEPSEKPNHTQNISEEIKTHYIFNKNNLKVHMGDIVTLRNLANNSILKIQITDIKANQKVSTQSEIKVIYYQSPIAVAAMNKMEGDFLVLNNLNVQYEIEKILRR